MTSSGIKKSSDLISNENDNNFNFSPEIIISQITDYFQGRISKDINDMVGHIINTLNSSREGVSQTEDLLIELEKYKCIVRIQQSLLQITNYLNKNGFAKE